MKSHLGVLLLAGVLALLPSARAQAACACPAEDSRATPPFDGSLRFGLGVPSGEVYGAGPSMHSLFQPEFQVTLDLGGMVDRHVFLGTYFGVGVGRQAVSPDLTTGEQGITSTARAGLQLQIHMAPGAPVRPWLGFGAGLTGAVITDKGTGTRYTGLLGGIDFAHLMAGLDLELDRELALGVFVDYSIGEYFVARREVEGVVEFDGPLPKPGVHHWLMVGPRLTF